MKSLTRYDEIITAEVAVLSSIAAFFMRQIFELEFLSHTNYSYEAFETTARKVVFRFSCEVVPVSRSCKV